MKSPRWMTSRDKGATVVVDLDRKDRTTGMLLRALLVHHLGYDLDDVLGVEVTAPGTVTVTRPALDDDGMRYVDVWGDLATFETSHGVTWPNRKAV